MKKNLFLISMLSLLFVLLGTGAWMVWMRPYVRTNDALIDGFKAAVCPDISARIVRLYVDEGSIVRAGDLLCELDDTILQSQRAEAEARVLTLQTKIVLQRYHFEKIRNDLERAKQGFEDGVTTAQMLDHAQKNHGMAKARLEAAEASLEQAKKELGVVVETIAHTKIYAPFDGAIVRRWLYVGDVPAVGQAIFSLYDLKDIWVVANLEETKVKHVQLGSPVDIHIDAYPGKTFHGKVFVIKGAAASEFSLIPQDNATGNYTKVAQRVPLKITIDHEKDAPYLFPGLSAEVKIQVH